MSKRTVLEIIVVIAFVCLLILSSITIKDQRASNEHLQKYLNSQRDSLEQIIDSLEEECKVHEQRVGSLEAKISNEQEKYKLLYRKYEKEISNVSHYGHSELERFFSDRYN